MNIRLLCLALAPLLLGGCDYTITLAPSPIVLYQGDTAAIGITLKNKNSLWLVQSRVTLTSDNPAAIFIPATGAPSQSSIVTVNAPSTTTPGIASDTITAMAVNHDTVVTINGVWRFPPGNDPNQSVTITVRPPKGTSPVNGTDFVEVLPSISEKVFIYEIRSQSTPGGTPADFVLCDLQFTAKVTVTILSAFDSTGAAVTNLTVVQHSNNLWHVSAPAPAPGATPTTFRKLTVRVVSSDTNTGGTTMFTCEEASGTKYVTSAVGPLPTP
jgi:hypothetical protein